MPQPLVRSEIAQGVAHIVLTRPARRNALTKEMVLQLTRLVRQASQDQQVRLIMLAAEGPVFCAGMDLVEMQQRAAGGNGPTQWREDAGVYRDLLLSILEAPQPTLAVVQGPALAGGAGVVLACDLVVACEEAYFSLPEPQRGITASLVTPLLAFRTGASHASQLLLGGQRVGARQLNHWGIYHQVVASAELPRTATAWTASILQGSPAALAATKQQIRECAGPDLADQLRRAVGQSAEARETADAREGLQAFLEKRKPKWYVD